MNELHTIYQQRQTDCGAASVAMLCGVGYDEAAEVVFRDRKIGITASGRLLAAVESFGGKPLTKRCIARKQTDLTELSNDALLKCKMLLDAGKSCTHWAVWDCEGQTIRDPYGYWYPLLVTHLVEVTWE